MKTDFGIPTGKTCDHPTSDQLELRRIQANEKRGSQHLILIGASTGGVDALLNIIKCFPKDCPPTFVVQHTGGQFAQSLIRLLNSRTAAAVCEAIDGGMIEHGHIYLAPNDKVHLRISSTFIPKIVLSQEEPVSGHRPSIDVLFGSACHLAPNVTAALLTGMGRDGASGITALRRAGARTIGQDEKTSVVYGMPRIAAELGGIERQLPISTIGPTLLKLSHSRGDL